MTVCLLCDKIHKNQAENLLHLMLYFSEEVLSRRKTCINRAYMLQLELAM